jgi:hypothetical protein
MLILDVWREACRHMDIREGTEAIASVLPPELPPCMLLIRRFDFERSRLETLAVGCAPPGDPLPPARSGLSPQRMAELLAWCRAGRIARYRSDAVAPPVDAAVPAGLNGDVMVGPLLTDDGVPLGVAVLAARILGAVHESSAQRLLEPLAVALTNDARLRALLRERDLLEAERVALRARLGGESLEEPAPAPAEPVIPLDAATVRHIEEALRSTDGRIEGERGAAALLGINPHTLRSRMRKLGILWAGFRPGAPPPEQPRLSGGSVEL